MKKNNVIISLDSYNKNIESNISKLKKNLDYNNLLIVTNNKEVFDNIKEYKVKYYKKHGFFNKTMFNIKYFYRFNKSICYDEYSLFSNFITRYASVNSYIIIRCDYITKYNNDLDKINNYFNDLKLDKFKIICFINNKSKDNFLKIYPRFMDKVRVVKDLNDLLINI